MLREWSMVISTPIFWRNFASRERNKQEKNSLLSRHVLNNKCFPAKKNHKSYNYNQSRDLIKLRKLNRIVLVITASDTRGVEMT